MSVESVNAELKPLLREGEKTVWINVAQQLKAPVGTVRSYTVNEKVDVAEGNCLVQGEIELTRTNRGILAEGNLQAQVKLTCSRCLDVFTCLIPLNIEEEFFPTTDVLTGTSLPSPDDPDSFTIDENNILDLTEAIRQYTLLAMPMKPLCREDCVGLCPPEKVDSNRSSHKHVLS